MAHRTFTDSRGVAWEVWDVIPGRLTLAARDHRVAGAERRVTPDDASPPHVERRLGIDRRASLSATLRHGWLAFRSEGERRRLAPIPDGWEVAAESELARYCDEATPVPFPPRT